ncbi:hypothetical protein [Algoriphagus sediminis]|uniref:Uncharacterized protein n=1 Tax=Algoriphagus sediminis TaxID=3057113 RepID=A0ABT7YCH0_9BACT|nr:hypothetical protein [Algoriphagus sediminis]MDN3204220.1 hypothetical protein [Algoriphagus sediminis]
MKKLPFVALLTIGFFFFVGSGYAQSEQNSDQDKENPDVIKDRPVSSDVVMSDGLLDIESSTPSKNLPNSIGQPKTPTRQEEKTEKVVAKKEEGASTLSFNLFLYIVDKFKAD